MKDIFDSVKNENIEKVKEYIKISKENGLFKI